MSTVQRQSPQATTRFLSRRRFLRMAAGACLGAAFGALAACGRDANRAEQHGNPNPTATPSAPPSDGPSPSTAPSEPLQETAFLFDTVITLTAYCDKNLMQRALDRCRYFENRLSRTLEGSDVWNVNHASGRPVDVAPETADAINQALAYCRQSEGLFDITIGAVSSLWDFSAGVKPDDGAISEAVTHVDWRGVHVEGTSVTLDDPAAMIDLGGIAKGYIADDLARLFQEGGCESGIINLGGNVFALGSKPDGSNWRVGIQDPNALSDAGAGNDGNADAAVIAVLECAQTSVVTSGLYERAFTLDGQRYHHILDPRTGYPAETDLASVSVASASSTEGDACATWMFLLGHDKALEFLDGAGDVEGLVVSTNGDIDMTSNARFELC